MKKLLLGVVLGVVLGAVLASIVGMLVLSQQTSRLPTRAEPAINTMLDEIESQDDDFSEFDENRFAKVKTISDIMKIKSDFRQTEMLHVLAGRAPPRELIALIAQADLIHDASDRGYALSILFSRLTEVSPELALEAASDMRFVSDEGIARAIWRTWARQDFDAALLKVTELTPLSRKELAARSMYWAVGVFGNERTKQIKRATGVNPTRWAISQAIEKIARQSIPDAIARVNQLHTIKDQRYVAYSIASLAAAKDPDLALSYTDLFKSSKARDHYGTTVLKVLGANSPKTVLQNWSNDNYGTKDADAAYSALTQYAFEDFEEARAYVDQMPNSASKTGLVKVLLAIKSRASAIDALSLAQQYQQAGHKGVLNSLVSEMVKASPLSTLLALDALPDIANHKHYVARAVGGLAELDPQQAVNKIQLMTDIESRNLANQELIVSWARADVNAALSYALTLDGIGDGLKLSGISLKGVDIDLGMRFVDKFGQAGFDAGGYSFAADLSSRYSTDELLVKLQPYRSNQSFDRIRNILLSTMFKANSIEAELFIETFWSNDEKAKAYMSYAGSISYQKPEAAFKILDKLDNLEDQQVLLASIVSNLGYRDKNAARLMVDNLPPGQLRDAGVSTFAGLLSPDSKQDIELIGSIQNETMREDALVNMLTMNIKTAGDKVIKLGRDLGLSQEKISYLELVLDCRKVDYRNLEYRRKCRAMMYHGS